MYEVSTKYVVLLLQYALVLLDGRPINYSWALQIFTLSMKRALYAIVGTVAVLASRLRHLTASPKVSVGALGVYGQNAPVKTTESLKKTY